jgi:hypothetical protein
VFNKNSLNIDAFENCQFYDCKFYNLKIIFDKKSNRKLFFSNCIGHEEIALAVTVPAVDEEIDFDREYKKKILEQYWKPGYERAELRKTYNTLFRGIPQQNKEEIVRSIDALIREKILIQRDHCIELNISEINKIKDILERF